MASQDSATVPGEWQFLQCFGERTPGEDIQEGGWGKQGSGKKMPSRHLAGTASKLPVNAKETPVLFCSMKPINSLCIALPKTTGAWSTIPTCCRCTWMEIQSSDPWAQQLAFAHGQELCAGLQGLANSHAGVAAIVNSIAAVLGLPGFASIRSMMSQHGVCAALAQPLQWGMPCMASIWVKGGVRAAARHYDHFG